MVRAKNKGHSDQITGRLKNKHWIKALMEIERDDSTTDDESLQEDCASWTSQITFSSDLTGLSALFIGVSEEERDNEDWEVVSDVSSVHSINTAPCKMEQEETKKGRTAVKISMAADAKTSHNQNDKPASIVSAKSLKRRERKRRLKKRKKDG